MTALVEADAGLALVMSIALLCTWRIGAASVLLAVQSAAVALAAVLLRQPLMALPPLLLAGGFLGGSTWLGRFRTATPGAPTGSAMRGIGAGAVLVVLSLSQEALGLPLAIVLLAILFVVTRPQPPLQVMGLIAVQNGLVLAGCLVAEPAILSPVLLPVVCLVLPVPLAAHLLIPPETKRVARAISWSGWIDLGLSIAMFAATLIVPLDGLASVFAPLLGFDAVVQSYIRRKRHGLPPPRRSFALLQSSFVLLAVCAPNVIVAWLAIVGAIATFLLPRLRSGARQAFGAVQTSVHVPAGTGPPLTPLSSGATHSFDGGPASAMTASNSFAPAFTAPRTGSEITISVEVPEAKPVMAAVGPPSTPCSASPDKGVDGGPTPAMTWKGPASRQSGRAVAVTISNGIVSTRTRRWDAGVLAFTVAGIALFGLLMLPSLPLVLGYFSLFAGFAGIAAVVPDLAVVLVILLLRLASQSQWPPGAEALGSSIALIALLACAHRLVDSTRPHRATLLQLGQCCIALLAICSGEADGRFAALILLILLILTRSAARVTGGFASTLAMAGLGGVPPLGVFPALVLVVMVVGSNEPWLLLPIGAALIPMFLASLPRHPVVFPFKAAIPAISWLPFALTLLVGYFAPNGLVHWWHVLTAGRS